MATQPSQPGQMIPIQALISVEHGQIVAGNEFQLALEELKRLSGEIEKVKDQSSYASALEVCAKGKADIRAIEAAAEPERLRLQDALKALRGQRDKIVGLIEEVIQPLERKARDWKIAETEAAAAEQAKLNKGKRAEGRVTVRPDVPVVSGTRMQINYKFEVTDPSKVKREFLCPDEVAIGQKVRKDKDPEKSMKAIGGVRVWKA